MSVVEFLLESPLLIGGKRLVDNVLESSDYIPGHVMRAGFARYILQRCPLYKADDKYKNEKLNYIYIRDMEKCKDCELNNACENFGDIKFSFFYPKNFDIIPLSNRSCKNKSTEHGMEDSLLMPENSICTKCKNENDNNIPKAISGRMESTRGFLEENKKVSLEKILITKSTINPYTQTSEDGKLFSIYAIKPYFENDNRNGPVEFVGKIDGFEKLNLSIDDTINVGSRASIGLGRLKFQRSYPYNNIRELKDLINKFNTKNFYSLTYDKDRTYIPILFKSDAKLGFEGLAEINKPLNNDDYKKIWMNHLFGNSVIDNINIEQIIYDSDIYRGFDTSSTDPNTQRKAYILIQKGTTILLSTEDLNNTLIDTLSSLEKEGIGSDTLNGFGEIEVCNKLHLQEEI